MAALLYNEPPIAVSPTLCRLLGLPEAVFLQQLHFRLQLKRSDPKTYEKYRVDGLDWVYWTQQQLIVEIPLGRTADTHKRVIKRLRALGVLLVRQLRVAEWDRTNFYTIDYGAFDDWLRSQEMNTVSIGGNGAHREVASPPIGERDCHPSMCGGATGHTTEIATETCIENSSERTTTTSANVIEFHPACEEYRSAIESAISGLPEKLAQQVVDEIAGALVAAEKGQRTAIQGLHGWIQAVANSARNGKFCFQQGKPIARERKKRLSDAQKTINQEKSEATQQEARRARNKAIEDFLAAAPDAQLRKLATLAEQNPGLLNPRQRSTTVKSILQRKLPESPLERSVVTSTVVSFVPGISSLGG
jgi:hypothetical protein